MASKSHQKSTAATAHSHDSHMGVWDLTVMVKYYLHPDIPVYFLEKVSWMMQNVSSGPSCQKDFR